MMKRLSSILGLGIFWAWTAPTAAQLSPEQAVKSFTVADGLQIELFASEPLFVNPTCIDIDHKGRVWVCESVNYRCRLHKQPLRRPEGDRIVVLEDTNGDGKADKAHTFYQHPDFIAPLGMAVAPEPPTPTLPPKGGRENRTPSPLGRDSLKVYVCHSPHIYLFEDKDGDLKADGPPKILLTGFKGYDHDHGVHGIHFGPDGKLYFSVGDQGVDGLKSRAASAPRETKVWKTNQTDCQAGTIWRCDPDGSNVELLAHNFRNQYEPAVDSFGTMFVSDNDDDGNQQTRICYVMYGGNYGYWPRGKGESHWHEEQPGVVHKVLRTYFGSPTGMCWYEGTLLQEALSKQRSASSTPASGGRQPPDNFYGFLLHTDAGPREVRCFFVKTKGAGYELDKLNLVTSSDNWFRPSDVCVAPDGSAFVADWYDPGVGGHGIGDTTRGRIYRITPKGHKGYSVPSVDLLSNQGILAALVSPNLAIRQMAIQKTREMDDESFERLRALGAKAEKDRQKRLAPRFLWLVSRMDTFGDRFLRPTFLIDPGTRGDNRMRVQLVRVIHDEYGSLFDMPKELHADFRRWAQTKSAAVQRELLLALRKADASFAKDWIYDLAKHYDGQDHFYLAAIGIAVGTDPKRREIILADFEKHFPEWNDKVAKLVWELRPPHVLAKLDQRLADPKLTLAQKAFILDILAVSEAASAGPMVLKLLADDKTPKELRDQAWKTLTIHLPGKWAALKGSDEVGRLIDRLMLSADKEGRVRAVELIALAEREKLAFLLPTIAKNALEDPAVRRAAIRGLPVFKTKEGMDTLARLIEEKEFRKEALDALGQMQTPEALRVLQAIIKDDKRSIELRQAAVEALASSRPGTEWLLDAQDKKELPAALVAEAGRILRNSPYVDLRNRALMAFPAPAKLNPKQLPEIAKLATRRGDPMRGRQLFLTNKDLACARCHSVRGAGGTIGPDLSVIGKKASRENLLESLLYPDKAIADQYVQWVVETQQGLLLAGLLVEEKPAYIVLRDAQGNDRKILKQDIESRTKSPKSIMPEDLVAYMTEQDLIDLVEYLATLNKD